MAWTQVSPSQIESYQKCNRLWFFKSVMRLPELQKGNQSLGQGVHLILEVSDRVEKGEIPRVGYEYNHSDVASLDPEGWEKAKALAAIMVPMVPRSKPGKVILRESKITLDTYPEGPTMIGYMDLGVPPGIGWPELMIPDHAAIIGDYKTTSDFRYMKTPAELADSVQMMTYAKWAIEDLPYSLMGDFPGSGGEVYLAHLYGRTKPPFTKNSVRHSVACVTVDQINAKWERTLDTIRQMDQDARVSDAQDIKPTGVTNDHCSAFGGCAYRDRCGLNAPNPVKNLFSIRTQSASSPQETQDMSQVAGGGLLAKIAAARAKAAGEVITETITAPVVTAPVVTAPVVTAPVVTAPVVTAPVVTAPIQELPAGAIDPSKGPISALLAEIQSANGMSKPVLSGLLALMYAKEQGIDFKPGSALGGTGSLVGVNCKTMGDLVALKSKGVATGIVPADAPPRTQPVITKPGDGQDPIKANVGTSSAPETDEDDGEPEASPGVVTGQERAPGKRGRPSNAELAARKAQEDAAREAEIERRVNERLSQAGGVITSDPNAAEREKTIADQVAAISRLVGERDALKSKLAQGAPSATQGFVLFVDCYPVKGLPDGTVDYLEWYAPIAAGAAEASGVDDWRLIQYTSKGVLATAMRLVVGAESLPVAMTISTNAPGYDVAMEVLSPLAKSIIRRM